MRLFKILMISACLCTTVGCTTNTETTAAKAEFSDVASVCELSTLKCYFHNIAKAETQASGLLKFLNYGYKKVWMEYDGVVNIGIDASQIKIQEPDKNNVVRISIPDAKILSIEADESSLTDPLTESGFWTEITTEDKTTAYSAAQDDMKKSAEENTALLNQAKERAKDVIEAYVINVGKLIDQTYTVEWVDA